MSRYKIVFLIVLAAVGLFIAAIVGSMFAAKEKLPNGYELSVGGKGETWIRSPDRQTLVTDVTSVWLSPERMIVERRTPSDTPPYKDRDCDYLVSQAKGPLVPVANAEAQGLIVGMKRETAGPKTCVR